MYRLKSRGPRMDPWGTPHVSGVEDEDQLPIVTEKLLSSRYELSQFKTVPDSPTQCSSQWRRMAWSTVSNAALRSSKTSTDALCESELRRISFKTLIRAVSVL